MLSFLLLNINLRRCIKEIDSLLADLGVPHAMNRLTDDGDGGYFTVDVYLPDGDVAIEFDGPLHFMTVSDGGDG